MHVRSMLPLHSLVRVHEVHMSQPGYLKRWGKGFRINIFFGGHYAKAGYPVHENKLGIMLESQGNDTGHIESQLFELHSIILKKLKEMWS